MTLAQSMCGLIGNDTAAKTQVTAAMDRRFYLNTANPAACNGTITSWRVCYYGPNSVDFETVYWATYAVYRKNGTGENERYEKVSRMFSAVRTNSSVARLFELEDGGIQQGGFVCYSDSTGDTPVTVQAGDIIGACIFNPANRDEYEGDRLNIVGRQTGTGESLLELSESEASCSRESIPSEILKNDLSVRNDRRLHLYANIGKQYRLVR